MIDVVGHFGSRLSYATVSEQVAEALRERDALGSVINLDAKWLDESALAEHRTSARRGDRVILIADPKEHLVDAFVGEYGRDNVAIFLSPNTNSLSDEHLRACGLVARIYVPSKFCADAIFDSVVRTAGRIKPQLSDGVIGLVTRMPLGVDTRFTGAARPDRTRGNPLRFLHVTTDTFWPGRKGTEELITAWGFTRAAAVSPGGETLTIHCLTSLYPTVHQELGDHGLIDAGITVLAGPTHGDDTALVELFANHDILVAPSRSEGFGIMPLSALMSGMPVLTTAGTGQDEYLYNEKHLDGWMQIPTETNAALAGEDGLAPTVDPNQLALTLVAARHLWRQLLVGAQAIPESTRTEWSWATRRAAWADDLIRWW